MAEEKPVENKKEKFKATKKSGAIKGGGKRGALSTPEMEFIKQNATILDVKQISEQIGKSVETIRKYAYKANITIKDKDGQDGDTRTIRLRKLLKSREYWSEVQKMFDPDELKMFEDLWIKLYKQFDEDVLPTEELQINKHITLEITKMGFLKKVRTIQKQVEATQKTLDEEYAKPSDQKNMDAIKTLLTMIDRLEANQLEFNKQIIAIVDKQKDTEKALKGSREQRVKEYIDAEKNWTNAVRILENAEIRDQIGKHIEIMKAAQELEQHRLYDFHTFADGTLDRLVLNSDSVMLGDKDE